MNLYEKAILYAIRAHGDTKRRYTQDPYIVHPIEVSALLRKYTTDEDSIIAAILHDVVEDTDITIEDIEKEFGLDIALLVDELTDKFTKEAFPDLNRAHRKKRERERIASISTKSKKIKLCDMISNLGDFVNHFDLVMANDKDFAQLYVREKEAILEVIKDCDDIILWEETNDIMKSCRERLFL
jgi:(p)ppGpp synthase/HD superfamily hydrolase